MKKWIITIAILILLVPVFAWQESYRQSSEEVQLFYTLRRLSGTSTAEPTFPVSASQLLSLLQSLDTSEYGEFAMQKYTSLKKELTQPDAVLSYQDIGYDISFKIVPFQYWKSEIDKHFYPFKDLPMIVEAENLFNVTPYFSALMDLNLQISESYASPKKNIFNLVQSWSGELNDGGECELYLNIPNRAYGSVGIGSFNLTAGRDRLSAGNSFTGNLELNENFDFEDYLKAGFVRDKFSYDMSFVDFNDAEGIFNTLSNPRKNVVIHRLSASFFNHMTVSLSEGAMVYTGNIFSTPMIFNPFMLIHDWFSFMSGNTNNFCSVELEGNFKGFEVSFQYFFDQINNKFEDNNNGKNANALLFNASYTHEFESGILTVFGEYAYTSGLCYLKETVPEYNATEWIGKNELLDLYMGTSSIWGDAFGISSIGYPYGTDVNAIAAGAEFLWKNQKITANFYHLNKGPMGIEKNEQRAADKMPEEGKTAITKMTRINVGLEGTVYKCISYNLTVGYNFAENLNHIKGNNLDDVELTFVVKVDPCELINRKALVF